MFAVVTLAWGPWQETVVQHRDVAAVCCHTSSVCPLNKVSGSTGGRVWGRAAPTSGDGLRHHPVCSAAMMGMLHTDLKTPSSTRQLDRLVLQNSWTGATSGIGHSVDERLSKPQGLQCGAHLAHVLLRHLHVRLLERLALLAVDFLRDHLRRAHRKLEALPPADSRRGKGERRESNGYRVDWCHRSSDTAAIPKQKAASICMPHSSVPHSPSLIRRAASVKRGGRTACSR